MSRENGGPIKDCDHKEEQLSPDGKGGLEWVCLNCSNKRKADWKEFYCD